MTQDLQSLLEKIQRDGVAKAQAESDRLLEEARAQAKAVLDKAHAEAARITSGARQEAEAFERRAEETIRQAARDTLLQVEKAVTALFEGVLLRDVNAALNDETLAAELAAEAMRAYLRGGATVEVRAAGKLADALRARLAAEAGTGTGLRVVTDEYVGAGFVVRVADGRVEHTFTGAAVADALSKLLRPRLAAFMKTAG